MPSSKGPNFLRTAHRFPIKIKMNVANLVQSLSCFHKANRCEINRMFMNAK
jgi:hypothetical protein